MIINIMLPETNKVISPIGGKDVFPFIVLNVVLLNLTQLFAPRIKARVCVPECMDRDQGSERQRVVVWERKAGLPEGWWIAPMAIICFMLYIALIIMFII